jgi:hypothetical protein
MPVALVADDQSKCRIHLGYSPEVKKVFPGDWNRLTLNMQNLEDTVTRDRVSRQIAICETASASSGLNEGGLVEEQLTYDGEVSTSFRQRPNYTKRLRYYSIECDRLARMLGVRNLTMEAI